MLGSFNRFREFLHEVLGISVLEVFEHYVAAILTGQSGYIELVYDEFKVAMRIM